MFVKICGITSEEDALLALALGADALGFVFVAGSPRMVTPAEVAHIVKRLPHDEVLTVGVFRDEQPQRVTQIVNRVGLHAAQLHGREPPAEVAYVRQRVRYVIQGFAAGDPALDMAADGPADIVLIDAPTPGSGRVFDWGLAKGSLEGARLLLAGGLTPENVADAIAAVDVSTGVETAPGSGRKDPRKLRRFIEAARVAATVVASEEGNGENNADGNGDGEAMAPYDWQAELA